MLRAVTSDSASRRRLERLLACLTDAKYLLGVVPRAQTDKLRAGVRRGLDTLLELLYFCEVGDEARAPGRGRHGPGRGEGMCWTEQTAFRSCWNTFQRFVIVLVAVACTIGCIVSLESRGAHDITWR